MIFSGEIRVSILSCFILSVATVAEGGQCPGTVDKFSAYDGVISSPNYPDELGAIENCSWIFAVPTNEYLVLEIDDLKLHFADYRARLQCRPSYILKINGERLGCDPPRLTDWRSGQNQFCMQFKNSGCLSNPLCNVTRTAMGHVEITYEAIGEVLSNGDWTPYVFGFRIRYKRFHCRRSDLAKGVQCPGTVDRLSAFGGAISSPNYPDELGAREICSWIFEVPTNTYLVLDIGDLQLHYTDYRDRLFCTPSYSLKINGGKQLSICWDIRGVICMTFTTEKRKNRRERLGCDPPRLTDWRSGKNRICRQFQNSGCLSEPYCNVKRTIADRVEITYEAAGTIISRDWTPHMVGFRIGYERFHCRRWDFATVAKWNRCPGTVDKFSAFAGAISSPNYPDELGARENCVWTLKVPTNQYLVLDVDELQLHFTDYRRRLHCTPSYRLNINGERLGCDPPRLTDWRSGRNRFCMQFQSSDCLFHPYCKATRRITGRVQITYEANGTILSPREWTPYMVGFKIRFSRFYCRPQNSSATYVTWQHKAKPQNTLINSTSRANGSVIQKTTVSTIPTLTEEMADLSTTLKPEGVTNSMPAALDDENWTAYWTYWTSAILGGALGVVVALLFVLICHGRHMIHQRTRNHIPPIEDNSQEAADPAMERETVL